MSYVARGPTDIRISVPYSLPSATYVAISRAVCRYMPRVSVIRLMVKPRRRLSPSRVSAAWTVFTVGTSIRKCPPSGNVPSERGMRSRSPKGSPSRASCLRVWS